MTYESCLLATFVEGVNIAHNLEGEEGGKEGSGGERKRQKMTKLTMM